MKISSEYSELLFTTCIRFQLLSSFQHLAVDSLPHTRAREGKRETSSPYSSSTHPPTLPPGPPDIFFQLILFFWSQLSKKSLSVSQIGILYEKWSHYESQEVFSGEDKNVPFRKRISSMLNHYLMKVTILPTADKITRIMQGKL